MPSISCPVDGCSKDAYRKGFCYAHYMKDWRYGTPTPSMARVGLTYAGSALVRYLYLRGSASIGAAHVTAARRHVHSLAISIEAPHHAGIEHCTAVPMKSATTDCMNDCEQTEARQRITHVSIVRGRRGIGPTTTATLMNSSTTT